MKPSQRPEWDKVLTDIVDYVHDYPCLLYTSDAADE